MADSILTTVKESLGLEASDTSFDRELIVYTNTVLATLNQIGVGPEAGFQIANSSATWDAILGSDPRLNNVQTYIGLAVRLIFDPPQSSFGVEAVQSQIKMLETRIYLLREAETWIPPTPEIEDDEDLVLDGGEP